MQAEKEGLFNKYRPYWEGFATFLEGKRVAFGLPVPKAMNWVRVPFGVAFAWGVASYSFAERQAQTYVIFLEPREIYGATGACGRGET